MYGDTITYSFTGIGADIDGTGGGCFVDSLHDGVDIWLEEEGFIENEPWTGDEIGTGPRKKNTHFDLFTYLVPENGTSIEARGCANGHQSMLHGVSLNWVTWNYVPHQAATEQEYYFLHELLHTFVHHLHSQGQDDCAGPLYQYNIDRANAVGDDADWNLGSICWNARATSDGAGHNMLYRQESYSSFENMREVAGRGLPFVRYSYLSAGDRADGLAERDLRNSLYFGSIIADISVGDSNDVPSIADDSHYIGQPFMRFYFEILEDTEFTYAHGCDVKIVEVFSGIRASAQESSGRLHIDAWQGYSRPTFHPYNGIGYVHNSLIDEDHNQTSDWHQLPMVCDRSPGEVPTPLNPRLGFEYDSGLMIDLCSAFDGKIRSLRFCFNGVSVLSGYEVDESYLLIDGDASSESIERILIWPAYSVGGLSDEVVGYGPYQLHHLEWTQNPESEGEIIQTAPPFQITPPGFLEA